MKKFITSDLHWHHKGILKFPRMMKTRGDLYPSVEIMDASLIKHWNSVVTEEDIVYVVGDVSLGSGKKGLDMLEDLLCKLHGHIVLIKGNHDHSKAVALIKEHGHEVYDYLEINDYEHKIVLCHYPMASWNKSHYGSVMLHGHCHGTYSAPGRILDVGWDAHGRILTLKEAYDMAAKKPIYSADGH